MFGRTTIANLQEELLWLHTLVAVFYLGLTLALMRRFTSGIPKDMLRHVLLIYYPCCKNKGCRKKGTPKDSFEAEMETWTKSERVGRENVENTYLCYDVFKLEQVHQHRERLERILKYYQNDTKQIKYIMKYMKSIKDISQEDLVKIKSSFQDENNMEKSITDFIESAISKLKAKENTLKNHPLHKAFVVMHTESAATRILKDFNTGGNSCRCGRDQDVKVQRAVHPTNVYWTNLSLSNHYWWMCIVSSVFIFICLLFLSTPSIIITSMDKLNITIPFSDIISPTIKQFFPTLLLWVLSSLLPATVYYCTKQEPHWTRSSENMSMLYKLYIFLLTMVLLLPSFDLTSLQVINFLLKPSEGKVQFHCIFLPDQGAFFVNYVITSALSGGAMELLWFQLPLWYRMSRTHLPGEKDYIKKQRYEFPFGAMYAWYLCVFTVIMAYSITCPVIVPIGFAYLLLKHYVDRHNLHYAYQPPNLDRQVHLGAVKLTMAAPIICLLWLYLFSLIQEEMARHSFMSFMSSMSSLFTLLVLCITAFIWITHSCYGLFKYFCPFTCEREDDCNNGTALSPLEYIPSVLKNDDQPASTDQPPHDMGDATI